MLRAFPFPVKCVQTDNGAEFTKRFGSSKSDPKLTIFEKKLASVGIRHRKIRPYTPGHNGKAEHSHRKDNEYFYAAHRFYSFTDFQNQLKVHHRKYNNFPMRSSGWKSPKNILFGFLRYGVTMFDKPAILRVFASKNTLKNGITKNKSCNGEGAA